MKTYVITLSKQFMKSHPQAGQPTMFKEKVLNKQKLHTIRGNYDLWSKRLNEVQEGKALLSIREWEGMPYRSKQVEIMKVTKDSGCGVQRISMHKPNASQICWNIDDRRTIQQLDEVAKNDGLLLEDFRVWFFPKQTDEEAFFVGAIIHFTDFRY